MIAYKLIHLLAVLAWVGGMFFAYTMLRPAAAEALQPAGRMRLWNAVLHRFFNWMWAAIGLILITGFYLIYKYGGIAHVAAHVHSMLVLGLLMMVIYCYAFFGCYVPFSLHVAKKRWEEAEAQWVRIRRLIVLNLALGLLIIIAVEIVMAG